MTYCYEYNSPPDNGRVCCNNSIDSKLQAIGDYLNLTGECGDMMRPLLCTHCDPWQANLFGVAQNLSSPLIPFGKMCINWCYEFYAACSQVQFNWANNINMFGGTHQFLSEDWSTSDQFCSIFATDAAECFIGVPFESDQQSQGNQPICLEYWTESDWSAIPTCIQDPHDGTDRMFVVLKGGQIMVHNRSTGQIIGEFLSVPNVFDNEEAGFTNLAFHPNYSQNGRFFIHYSCILGAPGCNVLCNTTEGCGSGLVPACSDSGWCNADHISVVAEYRVDPSNINQADPNEVRRIMTLVQPYRIHNMGTMVFGKDGLLYITWGDGGDFYDPNNRAQNTSTLLGKVIRIDVDSPSDPGKNYHVPSSNPFFNNSAYLPEIWALGLRNPWRCSFDAADFEKGLFCGDVGQIRWRNLISLLPEIIMGGGCGKEIKVSLNIIQIMTLKDIHFQ